ncbi:MAG: tetratricopeptide repeat protein, partial [Planctomycetota bacterium]|nr:tetratricopeptide repeat protein [Planctomycetota bacterium]
WANVCLGIVITVGSAYLWLSWSDARQGADATGRKASDARLELPRPTYGITADGVRVATIDIERLTAWCRSEKLPSPPVLTVCEPAVADALTLALSEAARSPGAATWGKLGMICESLESHASAEAYFRRAMNADPSEHRWPYYLGCIYQVTGRVSEAIESFSRVIELQADYPLTYARLGQLFLERDDDAAAEEHLTRYVGLRPADSLGHVGLGRVALRRNKPRAALNHLLKGDECMSNDFQCHYYLGRAYAAIGETELATKHFEISSRLPRGLWFAIRDPLIQEMRQSTPSVDNLVTQFELLLSSRDWPRLSHLAEQIIERRPNDIGMMANLASIYRATKRYDDAHRLLDRALSIEPDLARLHLTRAEVLLAQGDLEAALTAARAAQRGNSDSAAAYNVMGRAFFLLKRYDEAESAMRRCVDLKPGHAKNIKVLADILRARGMADEAAKFDEAARKSGAGS